MSIKTLIIAMLVAVAFAQPLINTPLLGIYEYLSPMKYDAATTGAVVAGGWAFTGGSRGVYAMKMNSTQGTNGSTWYQWTANPVSQLFRFGNWSNMSSMGVIAVAGNTVSLFRMNTSMVWMANMYSVQNATFDIQSDSQTTPSYMYPAFVPNPSMAESWMFVIGTQNTSVISGSPHLNSMIYAFDPQTLNVVWSTQINSDTTNFAIASDMWNMLYFLAANTSGSFDSTVKLYKMYPNNGSIVADWWYDTQYYNNGEIVNVQVGYSNLLIQSEYGYSTLLALNGSVIRTRSFSSCYTMPFLPFLSNSTWYLICGSSLYMYSNETGASVMGSPFSASDYITCGAGNQMNNDLVFVAENDVYVINASGVQKYMTLPADRNGYTSYTCTGAMFDYANFTGTISSVLLLSFQDSYGSASGSSIAVMYPEGIFIGQAATSLSPVGAPVVDWWQNKVFVASSPSNGVLGSYEPILIGYSIPTNSVNMSSFVVSFSSNFYNLDNPIAYNASNRSTYYVSSSTLYTIDYMGNVGNLGTIDIDYMRVAPVIVGQYLVAFDSYYNKLYVYDAVANAIKSVTGLCDASTEVSPLVNGYQFVVICDDISSDSAANLIDVSASTLAIDDSFKAQGTGITFTSGLGGVFIDSTHLALATTDEEVTAFNVKGSPATAATVAWSVSNNFKIGNLDTVNSAPIVANGNVLFAGSMITVAAAGQVQLLQIGGTSGSISTVTVMKTQSDFNTKALSFQSGGVFGGGYLYVIGWSNISAYTIGGSLIWNYVHNGTVSTRQQGNPAILPGSGAICFYDMYGNFNVLGGFEGGLAWSYDTNIAAGVTYLPALTDNTSVFFFDGQYVVGADIWNGTIYSRSGYLDSDVAGFALQYGMNGTTVIAASEDAVVFTSSVNLGFNANPYFPGSGNSPSGGGSSSSGGSKVGLIAGVVGGLLVVVIIIVVIAKRGGGGGRTDDNYVPMNPSTQV